MENIDTKTRHKKGDKVHMFGSYGGGLGLASAAALG